MLAVAYHDKGEKTQRGRRRGTLGDRLLAHRLADRADGKDGLAFAAAGFSFGRCGAVETRAQGMVIDTLLRQLLPVLLFGAMVPGLYLADLAGLGRVVILHIRVVSVITTTTL